MGVKFTGRSPKDKYLVRDDTTRDQIWWSDQGENDNHPINGDTWGKLRQLVTDQLSGKRLFVVDTFCGANPDSRLKVRFITEVAWQAHFVSNMFIRPSDEELADYVPDFVVLNGSKTTNPDYQAMNLNSENFVAFNMTQGMQIIGGTWYGGEMKKGMFSMMNYLLPLKGMPSMHCSANVGEAGCGGETSELSDRYGPVGGTDVDIAILLFKARMFFSCEHETPEDQDGHAEGFVKKNPIKGGSLK